MKHFKLILVAVLLVCKQWSYGQTIAFMEMDIKFPTSFSSNDGKIVPKLSGNYPFGISYFFKTNITPFTPQDSLVNLDSTFYANNNYIRYVAVDTQSNDTIGVANFSLAGWQYDPAFYMANPIHLSCDSSMNPITQTSCNGEVYLNTNLTGSNVFWKNSYNDPGPYVQTGSWDFTSPYQLCSGMYQMHGLTLDNFLALDHYFSIYLEPLTSTTNNFNVLVSSTPSALSPCTATATASVSGASSPLNYVWDGIPGTSVENSLCPGLHTLKVVDNNSDSVSVVFGIADSANYFVNFNSTSGADTIIILKENCLYNFNIPTDSITIDNVYEISPDSVVVVFSSWQVGNATTMIDTAYATITNSPAWYIDITVYCFNKTIGSDVIKAIHTLDKGIIGYDEQTENQILFYPNPAHNQINIKESFEEVLLYSSQGELVLSANGENNVDVSSLPKGIYYVLILLNDSKGYVCQKLIIEK